MLAGLEIDQSAAPCFTCHRRCAATQAYAAPVSLSTAAFVWVYVCSGVQQVVAMEYRHIPCLAVLMPAGTKLLVINPAVRRGMLLLQKENVVLLGGVVRICALGRGGGG
jgi:hypothetical protein